MKKFILLLVFMWLFLTACARFGTPAEVPEISITSISTSITTTATKTNTAEPPSTLTSTPTASETATPTQTVTPSAVPTFTPTPTLQPITASNVNQLKEISQLGKGTINRLDWWPDDQTLAVTTYAGIYLYDANTFQQIKYIEPPDKFTLFNVALSPDGHTVASAEQSDNLIHLWDTNTSQVIRVLDSHPNEVNALAFSPDNLYLASGGYQRPVQLWDLKSGEVILTFEGRSAYLDFSPDGKFLVSAGVDRPFDDYGRVWEVSSGELISTFPNTYYYYKPWFQISSDEKLIYSEWDRGIHVRDIHTGNIINTLLLESNPTINFSGKDGKILIGGNPIEIWDSETNNTSLLHENVFGGGYLMVSPDGSKLVAGTNTLFVWDLEQGQELTSLSGFSELTFTGFSPDSTRLAVFPPTRIWDLDSGMQNLDKFCIPGSLGFSRDSHLVSSTCSEGDEDGNYHKYACLYNASTCEEVLRFEGEIEDEISSPSFSPDGSLFALAHGDNWKGEGKWKIDVWNTRDGELNFSLTHPRFYSMVFSPDGSYLVVGGSKTIRFIDPQTGEVEFEDFQTSPIRELRFTPDGSLLVSAGYSDIQTWNTISFEKSFSFPYGIKNLNGIDISPDGTKLAVIDTPYEVRILRLWDLLTGESIYTIEGEHHNWGKVKFNQDGTLLATTGLSSKGIQIWDINTGDLLWSYEKSPTVYDNDFFNFSPDGKLLTFVGRDGTVRVFAACDQECPALQTIP